MLSSLPMLVPLRTITVSAVFALIAACFSDPKDDEGSGNDNDDDDGSESDDEGSEDSEDSGESDDADSDSGGSDDGTTGTGTDTDDVPTCAEYCEILMDHCVDGFAQFSTEAACLAVCAAMPPGEYGQDLGNSVSCRYFHAINAGEDPEGSCRNAGPAGSGVCGGTCENFCFLQGHLCVDDLQQYLNTATCLAECATFPMDDNPFNTADADADTFNCRLKHLTYASLDPITHCPHIVADSATCN